MLFRGLSFSLILTLLCAAQALAIPTVSQKASSSPFAPATITVAFTTAPAVGDVLVIQFHNNGQTGGAANTYTPPAGWTQIDVDTAHAFESYQSFWHTVGSGEANSYVFTPASASRQTTWYAVDITGANGTTPIDGHGINFVNASTNFNTPSVTPTATTDLALAYASDQTNASTFTGPGGSWVSQGTETGAWITQLWTENPPQSATSATITASTSSTGYSSMIMIAATGVGPTRVPALPLMGVGLYDRTPYPTL